MTCAKSLKGKYLNPLELYDLLQKIAACNSEARLEGLSDHKRLASLLPYEQADKLKGFRLHIDGGLYDISHEMNNVHSREDGGGCTTQATSLRRNGEVVLVSDWFASYATLVDDSEDGEFGSPVSETRIVEDDPLAQEIMGRLACAE